jgi:hypothetical protein
MIVKWMVIRKVYMIGEDERREMKLKRETRARTRERLNLLSLNLILSQVDAS